MSICLHISREREGGGGLTAMIPAMTTGMMHFIMRSGRRTPIAEIPTPDLAVPYDAPRPNFREEVHTRVREKESMCKRDKDRKARCCRAGPKGMAVEQDKDKDEGGQSSRVVRVFLPRRVRRTSKDDRGSATPVCSPHKQSAQVAKGVRPAPHHPMPPFGPRSKEATVSKERLTLRRRTEHRSGYQWRHAISKRAREGEGAGSRRESGEALPRDQRTGQPSENVLSTIHSWPPSGAGGRVSGAICVWCE